uniref:reticulocyte-binding protein 2-like n=1 Tax=Styela clava TaxID=7725 RepID=UPI0019393765|nr:reticulocyte-binding protein 2-like [Styela clava]
MAQKGTEAISIAYVTQDGKFRLNMNNLNLLLDKLADKEDIAIISMAGKYRTGKSFMLSIFLRFLREKGWANTEWFGLADKKLNDGFKWESGTCRQTEGINVWPEIFDVPLQSGKKTITFLIRDWRHPKEFLYGSEGGGKYINKQLKCTSTTNRPQVQRVKKSIPKAYKNVRGFLLPRPGNEVDGGSDFSELTNTDITGEFRDFTLKLTQTILLPENLIVKEICGKPMSTNGFLSMIAETSKIFEKDGLPTVKTMLEGVENSNKIDALIEAVKMYNYKMKERIGDSILPEIALSEHDKDSLQEARKTFDDKVIIGSEDGKNKTWKKVVNDCKNDYERIIEENKAKELKIIQKIDEVLEEEIEIYEDKMNKLGISSITEDTLEEKHSSYLSQAVTVYESKTKAWNDILSNVITAKLSRLNERACFCFKNLKNQKIMGEQIKSLQEREELLRIKSIVQKTAEDFEKKLTPEQNIATEKNKIDEVFEEEIEKYEDKMNKLDISSFTDDTVEEKHSEYLNQALEAYESKTKAWNEILSNVITAKRSRLTDRAIREEQLKIENIVEKTAKDFERKLTTDITPIACNTLEEKYFEYLSQAVEAYKSKTEAWTDILSNVIAAKQAKMIEKARLCFENLKKKKIMEEHNKMLQEDLKNYKNDIQKMFEQQMLKRLDDYDRKCEDFKNKQKVEECREELIKKFNESYQLAKFDLVKKQQEIATAKKGIDEVFEEEIEKYEDKMTELRDEQLKIASIDQETADDFKKSLALDLQSYKPNIKEIFERQKQLKLDYYDGKCEAFENREKVEECREELIKKFNESYQLAKIDMEKKKEAISEKYKENVEIVCEGFRMEMEQLLHEGPLSNKEFVKKYGEIKRDALDKFSILNKNIKTPLSDSDVEQFKRKLIETVQRKYIDEYKKTNEINQKQLEKDLAACEKHVKSALDSYTREMDKIFLNGKYYEESDLKEQHNSYAAMAIDEFMKLSANIASWTKFIDDLRKQIQEKLLHYQSCNCRNREIIQRQKAAQGQIFEIAVELKNQYMRLMGKLVG